MKIYRDEWPIIRSVVMRGRTYIQVDARKAGTNGKRETFSDLAAAHRRADELEKLYAVTGNDALNFPASLRMDALIAHRLLLVVGFDEQFPVDVARRCHPWIFTIASQDVA